MAAGSAPGVVGELKEVANLVRDYAKQETIDPLKQIGRYLAAGVAGSLAIALGCIFLSMAVLRILQEETGSAMTGSWSWAPYFIAVVVLLAITGASLAAVRGRNK